MRPNNIVSSLEDGGLKVSSSCTVHNAQHMSYDCLKMKRRYSVESAVVLFSWCLEHKYLPTRSFTDAAQSICLLTELSSFVNSFTQSIPSSW